MTRGMADVPRSISKAKNSESSKNGSVARASANIAVGATVGTSKAVGKLMLAGFKSPFEVTLAAARGFHNVPKLYGDETVRKTKRITGIGSGLEVAGTVSLLL